MILKIKEYLSYNEITGNFLWKISRRRVKAGDIAGGLDKNGYIQIGFEGKLYRAHRLAWYFITGKFPEKDIDHINEIKTDNRICNLRLATQSENRQNVSFAHKDNKSGFLGVHWCNTKNTWIAKIQVLGKRKYIGSYDNPKTANLAYLKAKKELHSFWNGNYYEN
jgi:hypothetical protein